MRITKVLLGITTATILFTGCINSNPPKPLSLPEGYILAPMPDSTENSKTIAGIDSNNNGVRDDVEIWIHTEYQDKDTRQVMMQHARSEQNILLNVNSKKDVHSAWDIMDKSQDCERELFGWKTKHYRTISSKTLNTKIRVNKNKQADRLFGGEVYGDAKYDGSPCENY